MKGVEKTEGYALQYTGPEKSYIVEPHGGEINYKLADKNPLKFYDKVLNQDITKHKVRENKEKKAEADEKAQKRAEEGSPMKKQKKVPLEVSSRVTKRPHFKIMEKLR